MDDRSFTPEEVQNLIPVMEQLFGRLLVLRSQLEQLRLRSADANQTAPLAEEAAKLLARIQDLGCTIKDIDRGLVDFPARRGGETVLLCWQFGEKRLAWWHGAEEGFAGRKPLEQAEEQPVELLN
jgi:hypothetical protein